jgi:hypothetical protein
MTNNVSNSNERICYYCGTLKTYLVRTKKGKIYPKWYNNPLKEDTWICGKCFKNLSYNNALPEGEVSRSVHIKRIEARLCHKCGGKTNIQKTNDSSYAIWHKHPSIRGKYLCAKCYASLRNESKRKFRAAEERHNHLSKRFTGIGNPFFGKQHTEETKRRISLKKIGRPLPRQARIKMIGRPISANARAKIALKMRGRISPMKGKHHSAEAKLRISIANTGRAVSEDTKKKLSEANSGENNLLYGKHQSDEVKHKISESTSGINNHFFGKHHTETTKHMISEKNRGRSAWNKGLKMSEEVRRKLSISHIGIYPSKETLLKRSKSLTGLRHGPISENTHIRMRLAHLGKKLSDDTKAKMRRHHLNENAFDIITPESAYWVGMFAADGNISIKKGIPIVALHLQEADKDHLDKKFRTFVACTHKLGHIINKKSGRHHYSISFSSEKIANSLATYGIVPKKWFIIKIKGGLENNRDLWRGVMDGDGHIGIYPRKTSNDKIRLIPYISLTGNLHVCHQFKAFLEDEIHLPMPNIVSYKKSYQFSISDHRAVRAIKLLYENCSVALDRKLKVAKTILDSFQLQGDSRYIVRIQRPEIGDP